MVFLQSSHGLHLLLVMTFVLVHHTLALIMLVYYNWLLHRFHSWREFRKSRCFIDANADSASHRRPSTPVVVAATRSSLTDHFEWAFFFVNAAPVMVWTHLVSGTYFFNRCPFVPIMVIAPWSILADDSLVLTFGAVLAEEFLIF